MKSSRRHKKASVAPLTAFDDIFKVPTPPKKPRPSTTSTSKSNRTVDPSEPDNEATITSKPPPVPITKRPPRTLSLREKERIYDVNLVTKDMPLYEPLLDEDLRDYFSSASLRKHLQKVGLITADGKVVPKKHFKKQQLYLDELDWQEQNIKHQQERTLDREIEYAIRRQIEEEKQRISNQHIELPTNTSPSVSYPTFLTNFPVTMWKTALLYSEKPPPNLELTESELLTKLRSMSRQKLEEYGLDPDKVIPKIELLKAKLKRKARGSTRPIPPHDDVSEIELKSGSPVLKLFGLARRHYEKNDIGNTKLFLRELVKLIGDSPKSTPRGSQSLNNVEVLEGVQEMAGVPLEATELLLVGYIQKLGGDVETVVKQLAAKKQQQQQIPIIDHGPRPSSARPTRDSEFPIGSEFSDFGSEAGYEVTAQFMAVKEPSSEIPPVQESEEPILYGATSAQYLASPEKVGSIANIQDGGTVSEQYLVSMQDFEEYGGTEAEEVITAEVVSESGLAVGQQDSLSYLLDGTPQAVSALELEGIETVEPEASTANEVEEPVDETAEPQLFASPIESNLELNNANDEQVDLQPEQVFDENEYNYDEEFHDESNQLSEQPAQAVDPAEINWESDFSLPDPMEQTHQQVSEPPTIQEEPVALAKTADPADMNWASDFSLGEQSNHEVVHHEEATIKEENETPPAPVGGSEINWESDISLPQPSSQEVVPQNVELPQEDIKDSANKVHLPEPATQVDVDWEANIEVPEPDTTDSLAAEKQTSDPDAGVVSTSNSQGRTAIIEPSVANDATSTEKLDLDKNIILPESSGNSSNPDIKLQGNSIDAISDNVTKALAEPVAETLEQNKLQPVSSEIANLNSSRKSSLKGSTDNVTSSKKNVSFSNLDISDKEAEPQNDTSDAFEPLQSAAAEVSSVKPRSLVQSPAQSEILIESQPIQVSDELNLTPSQLPPPEESKPQLEKDITNAPATETSTQPSQQEQVAPSSRQASAFDNLDYDDDFNLSPVVTARASTNADAYNNDYLDDTEFEPIQPEPEPKTTTEPEVIVKPPTEDNKEPSSIKNEFESYESIDLPTANNAEATLAGSTGSLNYGDDFDEFYESNRASMAKTPVVNQPVSASSETLEKVPEAVISSTETLSGKPLTSEKDVKKSSFEALAASIPRSEPNLAKGSLKDLRDQHNARTQSLTVVAGDKQVVTTSNSKLQTSLLKNQVGTSSTSMVGSIQLNGSKISIASDESDEYLSPMSMRASTVNSQKRPSLLVTTLVRRASVSPTTPPGMLSNRASTVGSPPSPAGLEVDDDLIDNINFRPSRVSMNRRPSVRSPLSVTASNTNDDDDDDDSDVEGQKDEETVQSKVEPATTERTSITKPSQFSNTPKHESTSKSSQRPETNQSSKDLYKQPSSSSLQNKVKTPLRSSSNQSLSKDQPPLRSSSSESLKLTGRIKSVPSLASGQQSKLSSRTQSRDSLIPLESINSAFFGPKTRKSPSPLNKTESTENVAADNKISSNKELNESKPHSRASSIKKASSIQVSLNSTRHNSKEVLPLSVLSRSSSSASMHSTNHTSNKEKSSITHSRPTSRINSISAKPPTSKPSGTHSPTVRASQVGAPQSTPPRSSSSSTVSINQSRKVKSVSSLADSKAGSKQTSKENLLAQAIAKANALIETSSAIKTNDTNPVAEEPQSLPRTISKYVNVSNDTNTETAPAKEKSEINMALLMQSVLSLDGDGKKEVSSESLPHDEDSERVVSIDDRTSLENVVKPATADTLRADINETTELDSENTAANRASMAKRPSSARRPKTLEEIMTAKYEASQLQHQEELQTGDEGATNALYPEPEDPLPKANDGHKIVPTETPILDSLFQDLTRNSGVEPDAPKLTDIQASISIEKVDDAAKEGPEFVSDESIDLKAMFKSVLGLHSASQSKVTVEKNSDHDINTVDKKEEILKNGHISEDATVKPPLHSNFAEQAEPANMRTAEPSTTSKPSKTSSLSKLEPDTQKSLSQKENSKEVILNAKKSSKQTSRDDLLTQTLKNATSKTSQNEIQVHAPENDVVPGWNPSTFAGYDLPSSHSSNAASTESVLIAEHEKTPEFHESSPKLVKAVSKPSSMKGGKGGRSFSYTGKEGSSTKSLKAVFDTMPPQVKEYEPEPPRESITAALNDDPSRVNTSIWDDILSYDAAVHK